MHFIMTCGQAQNGKDTVADYLATSLDKVMNKPYWKRVSLASNVKKIYCDAFGVDLDFIEKWKTVPENPPGLERPVRAGLQFIGDGFRTIKGSIWIDKLFGSLSSDVGAICSDGRYINELKASKSHGGYNILVVRPDKLNDDPNGSEAQIRPLANWVIERNTPTLFGNSSEQPEEMQYIDAVLYNNGTKENLYLQVDLLVPKIIRALNLA